MHRFRSYLQHKLHCRLYRFSVWKRRGSTNHYVTGGKSVDFLIVPLSDDGGGDDGSNCTVNANHCVCFAGSVYCSHNPSCPRDCFDLVCGRGVARRITMWLEGHPSWIFSFVLLILISAVVMSTPMSAPVFLTALSAPPTPPQILPARKIAGILSAVEVSRAESLCDWRVTHHGFSYSTFGF